MKNLIIYYFDLEIRSKKFLFATLDGKTVRLDMFGMNQRETIFKRCLLLMKVRFI